MVDTLETKRAVNRLVPEVTAVRAVTSDEPCVLPRRILVVDDNEPAARKLQQVLEADLECRVDAVKSGIQALELLDAQSYSIVITDLRMPKMDGMELIRAVQERGLPVTLIVITGHGSIDEAVQAIRLGAYDFLTKPIDVDNLRLVVGRALRERALRDEVVCLREQLKSRYSFYNILS